ncbi:heme ABC exporter ATP-binding protein CcmA [Coralliovum pocilloporae]|uniref:heme ABC exporter ATP-binding protein CcmA n=1 Tax=Coralliovum pocilloporae TaxID=3066369 RepID=UPI003306F27F
MKLDGQNLRCVRGGRVVFDEVSFTAEAGRALLVRGRNGAGKSSLLRLIAGLIRKDRGTLVLDGGDPELDLPAQCHYFGHQDALKSALTVTESLTFWQDFFGNPLVSVSEALEKVDLAHLANLPAGYLSAGQRRRLSLARLLISKRPVWLMDEPTSALDAASEARLVDLMREHLADDGLIIAATHLPIPLEEADVLEISGVQSVSADEWVLA